MINELPIQPTARQPRGIVLVNSMQVAWIDWEVNNNGFYQADTFNVTLPISGQDPEMTLSWWAEQTALNVEIFVGFPANTDKFTIGDLGKLIEGQTDDLTIDLVARTVRLSGRDFTARLIDTKTTHKWQNKTASGIAIAIAKSHDLTPIVTATKKKTGKYYQLDHAKLTNQQSEWDLLTYLAHEEGFQVYVKGLELHFEPKDDSTDPYVLQWDDVTNAHPTFNGMQLSFSRNLTLAKDVIVKVRSWNQKQKKGFTKIAKATHNKDTVLKGAAQPTGEAQVYSYVVPNLTPEQALQKAQALLKNITQHEMKLSATLPADNILTPQCILQVKGTGAYDQDYYPDSVIRRMTFGGGYVMDVTAKNHNVESTVMPQ